jgi:hypothetical protein
MDLTKDALQYLVGLADPLDLQVEGLHYSPRVLQAIKSPVAEPLNVTTLDGFVEMLEAGVNGFKGDDVVIHVTDFKAVQLVNRAPDAWGRRQVHLAAKPLQGAEEFQFEEWHDHEDFCISLLSLFQTTPDLVELQDIAAHISDRTELKLEDTGVTQGMTLQRTAAFKEEKTIKPRVILKPYCTFREIDQPERDFIFRARQGGSLALFEADGGSWKIRAINLVAEWLVNRCHGSENAQVQDLVIVS